MRTKVLLGGTVAVIAAVTATVVLRPAAADTSAPSFANGSLTYLNGGFDPAVSLDFGYSQATPADCSPYVAAWSWDGRRQAVPCAGGILVRSANGYLTRRVAATGVVADFYDQRLSWAFGADRVLAQLPGDPPALAVIDLATGAVTRLSDQDGPLLGAYGYQYTADNSQIIFWRITTDEATPEASEACTYTVATATSACVPSGLPAGTETQSIVPSPSGRQVTFVTSRVDDGQAMHGVADVDGSNARTRLFPRLVMIAFWSPDGTSVVFQSGTNVSTIYTLATGATRTVSHRYTAWQPVPLPVKHVAGDRDGNGTSDMMVWDPGAKAFVDGGIGDVKAWGTRGDIPVVGDYNGDGKAEPALYRPSTGTWYIHGQVAVVYGGGSAIPVPADYDGDGKTDIAFFNPSNGYWYIRTPGSAPYKYGDASTAWIPVPADYTGDGKADITLYNSSNNKWYQNGVGTARPYGFAGAIPVPGDYDGDGKVEPAVYNRTNGSYYLSTRGSAIALCAAGTDLPVPADYDGNGTTDLACYNPATGRWGIQGQYALTIRAGAIPGQFSPANYLRFFPR